MIYAKTVSVETNYKYEVWSVPGLILFQQKEIEHHQPAGDNWVFYLTRQISSWRFSDFFWIFSKVGTGLILFQGKETEHRQPTGDNWVFCFTRHQMENLESILFVEKE